jgi:hypothetical protein
MAGRSEALGPQHRVEQIRRGEQDEQKQQHVADHGYTFSQSRRKPNNAQNARRPRTIIAIRSMNPPVFRT